MHDFDLTYFIIVASDRGDALRRSDAAGQVFFDLREGAVEELGSAVRGPNERNVQLKLCIEEDG